MKRVFVAIQLLALFTLAALVAGTAGAQQNGTSQRIGRNIRLDPRFDHVVPLDARLEQIADMLRQIGYDERVHKEESMAKLGMARFA